jgi:hypothetical protein
MRKGEGLKKEFLIIFGSNFYLTNYNMQKKEINKETKMRWLSRMFFSVSDSPNHDVNPYDDVVTFMEATVGSLNWGLEKEGSKERFCTKFEMILDLYDIKLSRENILKGLAKENLANKEVVSNWADLAVFSNG